MSSKVLAWVFANSPSAGAERLLLVAMADSAHDDGYLSGASFGSMNHLKAKCNFASKQTPIDARDRLAAMGEIVMRSADERGSGRHFEYILTMGRPWQQLVAVARAHNWMLPDRSSARTVQVEGVARTPSGTERYPDPMEPATARDGAHRGSHAAPPASSEQATEPVDSAESAPSDDRSTGQTVDGPGMVRERSEPWVRSPLSPLSQEHQPLAVAKGPEPRREREAVENNLIGSLRDALAELAPTVAFDLPSEHRSSRCRGCEPELLAHIAAWPDPEDAIAALVAIAALMIDHYGIPRSTNAWTPAWLFSEPPAIRPGEPLCLEHPLGDIQVPKRACAICRVAQVAAADTAVQ